VAAAELNALTAARELARLDPAAHRTLGTDPLARHTLLASTRVPSRRGDALAAQIYRTTADQPPPLCTSLGRYQACDPTVERMAWCAQKGYPGPITHCPGCSRRRDRYFAGQRQCSRPPDVAGGGDVRRAATDERAEGAHSGGAINPLDRAVTWMRTCPALLPTRGHTKTRFPEKSR